MGDPENEQYAFVYPRRSLHLRFGLRREFPPNGQGTCGLILQDRTHDRFYGVTTARNMAGGREGLKRVPRQRALLQYDEFMQVYIQGARQEHIGIVRFWSWNTHDDILFFEITSRQFLKSMALEFDPTRRAHRSGMTRLVRPEWDMFIARNVTKFGCETEQTTGYVLNHTMGDSANEFFVFPVEDNVFFRGQDSGCVVFEIGSRMVLGIAVSCNSEDGRVVCTKIDRIVSMFSQFVANHDQSLTFLRATFARSEQLLFNTEFAE